MKRLFLMTILLGSCPSFSQVYEQLDTNNINATVSDDGTLFYNGTSVFAGYEAPKGDGNYVIFQTTFYMAGMDAGSQLYASAGGGMAGELYPGPIASDYSSTYYADNFSPAIWMITKTDIQYHIANYMSTGYVPAGAIANWPAHGDPGEGVAEILAPFVDVNTNGVYEPMSGDYPYIQGDKAAFIILNDENGTHPSGSDSLGVELHVMAYQFDSADENIANTTFFNVKVFNRRGTSFTDFRFGLFTDFDLGSFNDDMIGCDSARNVMYVYNGINNDPGGMGQPGYGANPPSAGVMLLSENMASCLTNSA